MADRGARIVEICGALDTRLSMLPADRIVRVTVEDWEHIQGASFSHTVATIAVGRLDSDMPILAIDRSTLASTAPDPLRKAAAGALRASATALRNVQMPVEQIVGAAQAALFLEERAELIEKGAV